MAEACIFIHELDKGKFENNVKKIQSHVNIGTGIDLTIRDLAQTIKRVVGYKGRIIFDVTKPDGTPRKLLNVDLIKNLGWKAQTNLIDGLTSSYHDYLLRNIT
jgi:GDP-L-fucose synthase